MRIFPSFISSLPFPALSLCLAGMVATASAQNTTPVAANGRLQVCGNQLCNEGGHPIQLRGISTHGLQWYPLGDCLNKGSLDALAKDWGADILRISMYVQEGGYVTNPEKFAAQVDSLVVETGKRGMYALIDFHMLTPGDPMLNLDLAKTFFDRMAATHGSKEHVLYEICNEPNGGDVNWARIKTYADQVIPVIRKHDTKGLILVGTPGWSSLGVSGAGPWTDISKAKLADSGVLYTLHFYAGQHQDIYRNVLKAASAELPLFVSEFGTQAASGDGADDFTSAQAWLDLLQEKKISWINWNFSDDFRSGAVLKSGTCPSGPWTDSALKPAGAWIYERMRSPDDFTGSNAIGSYGRYEQKDGPFIGDVGSSGVTPQFSQGAWRIELAFPGHHRLILHNLGGRILYRTESEGRSTLILPHSAQEAGLRLLEVRRDGAVTYRQFLPALDGNSPR